MAALRLIVSNRPTAAPAGLNTLVVLAALVILAAPASAHTRLTRSTPAADTVLHSRAAVPVRLVFSEPIEAALATITITGPDGIAQQLRVRADARDVHAVLSDWIAGGAGSYRVAWHIVSADGHPIDGAYFFTVAGAGTAGVDTAMPPPPAAIDSARRAAQAEHEALEAWPPVPVLQAVLRSAASFFVLAAAGLLAFAGWRSTEESRRDTHGLLKWLCAGALVCCAAHALAWSFYATGGAPGSGLRALGTAAGRAEVVRVVFAALTLVTLLALPRITWATVFAWLALAATVAIGHAAVIHPFLLLPLKAIHLAGAAVWLGGLIILLRRTPAGASAAVVAETALRVSAVALIGVVMLAATGVAQSLIVLSPDQVLTSKYGALSLAKGGVLAVLVAMGAVNKLRNVPAVVRGTAVATLRRTVMVEIVVIVIAFLLAGALAYTSPPQPDPAVVSVEGRVES